MSRFRADITLPIEPYMSPTELGKASGFTLYGGTFAVVYRVE